MVRRLRHAPQKDSVVKHGSEDAAHQWSEPVHCLRLEHAGAEVFEYDGLEISLKGGGGPTCLTQPLAGSIPFVRGRRTSTDL